MIVWAAPNLGSLPIRISLELARKEAKNETRRIVKKHIENMLNKMFFSRIISVLIIFFHSRNSVINCRFESRARAAKEILMR